MAPLRSAVVLLCGILSLASIRVNSAGSLQKLNCETKHQVCYLKDIYATEEDRFKDVHNGSFMDSIEFVDCHIHTLPKMPFVKKITARAQHLERIDDRTFSTVKHLDVSHNRLTEFSARAFEWPAELQTLVLSGNNLLKDLSVVSRLSGLIDLKMMQMNLDLTLVDKEIFSKMSRLKRLNLSDNNIQSIPVGIFNKLESLESLDLSRNSISRVHSGAFVVNFRPIDSELETYHQFSINLASNNISIVENDAFLVVDSVDFTDNKLIGIGQSAFSNKSNLGTLIISKNRQLKNFNFLQNLPTLHTLIMSEMDFTFRDIPLQIFSKLDLLTTLDLSHNNIDQIPIGVFAELSSVNFVNLRHNRIWTIEFGTFSIRKYDLIDEIDLSYNQIENLNYLVFVPLKYLRTLLLHGNSLNYVSTHQLKRNKSLQNLGIQNNPVRCEDLIDLLASFKLVLDENGFAANVTNVNGIKCSA
ncbi:leucine-rich repeat-containing G-protein coupled receptor 4-like [Toxorhynchites rutilus septentrionalis]|uniref:leucine-rich repeat-containing G-protein coupled receptor 4-like n=1 Tax=Toxorhynchites rutilus septentrionalis TaxID=329112 RepID=UPI002478ADA8|nr:leucine-rich repeat-containing G-protein coupled receptor 4-like [Toxorhynchites rutilus septentrionalis]